MAFIAPAVVVLLVVVAYPIVSNIWLSFHEQNLLNPDSGTRFVGLANFSELLGSERFWQGFRNSIVLTVASVGLQILIALPLAILLNAGLRLQRLMRAVFVLPWATPTFVAAFIWVWLLHGQYGILNISLTEMGIFSEPVPWLALPATALAAVTVAAVWKGLPWVVLV
ncbi:MAG: sugar ABC transporter permease, partial [Acidimicrobiia bacterium]